MANRKLRVEGRYLFRGCHGALLYPGPCPDPGEDPTPPPPPPPPGEGRVIVTGRFVGPGTIRHIAVWTGDDWDLPNGADLGLASLDLCRLVGSVEGWILVTVTVSGTNDQILYSISPSGVVSVVKTYPFGPTAYVPSDIAQSSVFPNKLLLAESASGKPQLWYTWDPIIGLYPIGGPLAGSVLWGETTFDSSNFLVGGPNGQLWRYSNVSAGWAEYLPPPADNAIRAPILYDGTVVVSTNYLAMGSTYRIYQYDGSWSNITFTLPNSTEHWGQGRKAVFNDILIAQSSGALYEYDGVSSWSLYWTPPAITGEFGVVGDYLYVGLVWEATYNCVARIDAGGTATPMPVPLASSGFVSHVAPYNPPT